MNAPIALEDTDLCRDAARGDRDALARLLAKHQDAVWPTCLRGAGGRLAEAEDLLQETFFRAIRGIAQLDPTRSFRAWLTGIAAHVVSDRHRPASARRERADDDALEHATAASRLATPTPDDAMARALDEIDPLTRSILVLRYVEELSWDETGRLVGMSREAVKKRLLRGRAELRDLLGGDA